MFCENARVRSATKSKDIQWSAQKWLMVCEVWCFFLFCVLFIVLTFCGILKDSKNYAKIRNTYITISESCLKNLRQILGLFGIPKIKQHQEKLLCCSCTFCCLIQLLIYGKCSFTMLHPQHTTLLCTVIQFSQICCFSCQNGLGYFQKAIFKTKIIY